jgi:hypothetical protein
VFSAAASIPCRFGNILVPQVGQVPCAAGLPFFMMIAARKMHPMQPMLIPRLFWCWRGMQAED